VELHVEILEGNAELVGAVKGAERVEIGAHRAAKADAMKVSG
jgi:hypothetical protein